MGRKSLVFFLIQYKYPFVSRHAVKEIDVREVCFSGSYTARKRESCHRGQNMAKCINRGAYGKGRGFPLAYIFVISGGTCLTGLMRHNLVPRMGEVTALQILADAVI